jgi:hypothetical protein
MRTIAGLFDTREDAERAVRELTAAGIERSEISMIAQDTTTGEAHEVGSEAGAGAGAGAAAGATAGGLLGLLVGLGALAIPGIGPVIAAGPLAAAIGSAAAGTLVGAVGGAVAGGLIGALVGAGIPAEEAEFYAEGVRRGGTLLTFNVDDTLVEPAARIMEANNAVDVDERTLQWRQSGWTGFERDIAEGSTSEPRYTQSHETISARHPDGTLHSTVGDRYISADEDRTVRADLDRDPSADDKWEESSKAGTAGGTLAGAATGAAVGAAGGPVGAVIGGVAGAVTGAGVGAAGDVAGETAEDAAGRRAKVEGSSTWMEDQDRVRTGQVGQTPSDHARAAANNTGERIRDTAANVGHATDRAVGNLDEKYDESSKVGTAGGALAGAATGAAAGLAGGPVGAVVGGVAGAAVGGGLGAAGDAAGEGIEDELQGEHHRGSHLDFDAYDDDFRNHYQTYAAGSGYAYDQYNTIYRYGHSLATDQIYRGKTWSEIEPDARRRWEATNPNTWERFKDAVQYSWEKVSGRR